MYVCFISNYSLTSKALFTSVCNQFRVKVNISRLLWTRKETSKQFRILQLTTELQGTEEIKDDRVLIYNNDIDGAVNKRL